MSDVGRLLVGLGVVLVLLGVVFLVVGRVPAVGRLPGDIHLQRGNWSVYLPLASMLLVSLVLSLVLNALFYLFRR